MKKNQVIKFWQELHSSTKAEAVIKMHKGKPGYDSKRTLERYAQAETMIREDYPNSDIALKTGWSVTFIGKIRSWWESEFLKPEKQAPEGYLDLLQQWRSQIQFLSLGQLLNDFWFKNWWADLQRDVTEPKDVATYHNEIYERHWGKAVGNLKLSLPIEGENLLARLKKSYPESELWPTQESWGNTYGMYLNAFFTWCAEVRYITELSIGGASLEEDASRNGIEAADALKLFEEVKRGNSNAWLVIRLMVIAIACDILLLGIRERPPNIIWPLEAEKIRGLRSKVIEESIVYLPQHFHLIGINKIHILAKSFWDNNVIVNEKTMNLLQAIERLLAIQYDLHTKLNMFELSLSGAN